MEDLELKIDYRFQNKDLLAEALTHSSYGFERQCPFNERLEFLGDAVLGFVVSRELFLHFPDKNEGTLSKLKSVLVSSKTLAKKARELHLGQHLALGKGEKRAGGHKKASILADAMESLIGAIILDGGLRAAEHFILLLLENDIKNATLEIKNAVDFKTLLQERLQEKALGLPQYEVAGEDGPAHARRYRIGISVGEYAGPEAVGSSKKDAQQACARLLLEDKTFWNEHVPRLIGSQD